MRCRNRTVVLTGRSDGGKLFVSVMEGKLGKKQRLQCGADGVEKCVFLVFTDRSVRETMKLCVKSLQTVFDAHSQKQTLIHGIEKNQVK